MPIECSQLEGAEVSFDYCPNCGHAPFEPFMRGEVQRWPRRWLFGRARPHCAIICRNCKDIVAYEGNGCEVELVDL